MTTTHRETVGVFDDIKQLQQAADDLAQAGFDQQKELSLLANEGTVEDKLGHIYSKAEDIDNDPDMPPLAYTTPTPIGNAEGALIGAPMYAAAFGAAGAVIAAGGPITLTISAILGAGGVGAAAGGVIAAMVGKTYSSKLQEELDQGGLLLWVKTPDPQTEKRAKDVLGRHEARLVETHDVSNPTTKGDVV